MTNSRFGGKTVLAPGTTTTATMQRSDTQKTQVPPAKTWNAPRIPLGELVLEKEVFSTPGSVITKGTWMGQDVAVRRSKITSGLALQRFEHTVHVIEKLGPTPHCLPLLSVVDQAPNFCTIFPWMPRGSVHDLLHTTRATLPFALALKCCVSLANALGRIHACGFVHRDVKPSNLLIDDGWNVVLCDFETMATEEDILRNAGHARDFGPSGGRLKHVVGTIEYMAPELLQKQPATRAADIYALGIAMNELVTGTLPFKDRELSDPCLYTVLETRFNMSQLITAIVGSGLRPTLPSADMCPPAFIRLVQSCWTSDINSRPQIDEVIRSLEEIMQSVGGYAALLNAVPNMPDTLSYLATEQAADATNGSLDLLARPGVTFGTEYRPRMLIGDFADPASRGADRMEDRHFVLSPWNGNPDLHLIGIFDGHGGDEAAEFALKEIPRRLWAALGKGLSPEDALTEAFETTDRAFLSTYRECNSGCTATVVFVVGDALYVAHIGDCRAIIARQMDNGFESLVMTTEHTAHNTKEATRVKSLGGRIFQRSERDAPRVEGRVQVTRAIGDRAVKQFVPATPEITCHQLTLKDTCLMLCCDGVWEFIPETQLMVLIRDTVKVPQMVAKRICLEALQEGSNDNVTCVVAFMAPVTNCEIVRA
eukprot:comp15452_c0_seq1/m.12419 comp15452_c0_seq1/g.12419  ORF comp15452_c0_seq1/g.12419 comp15452_c0_seq1/m.12419 type:complete len:652 (-) comp15452_c0_seq1:103-2058(-)